jgi:adenylate kinase family enzyme
MMKQKKQLAINWVYTMPLAAFYKKEGMLLTISTTSSDDVINAIKGRLAS